MCLTIPVANGWTSLRRSEIVRATARERERGGETSKIVNCMGGWCRHTKCTYQTQNTALHTLVRAEYRTEDECQSSAVVVVRPNVLLMYEKASKCEKSRHKDVTNFQNVQKFN